MCWIRFVCACMASGFAAGSPISCGECRCVHDTGSGKRKRSDAKGVITRTARAPPVRKANKLYILRNQQKTNAWRCHQSLHNKVRGRCSWDKCPAILTSKASRTKLTNMYCEECMARKGKVVYLCNGQALCHLKFHNKYYCKQYLEEEREPMVEEYWIKPEPREAFSNSMIL